MRLVGLTVDLPSSLQFVPLDLSEGLPAKRRGRLVGATSRPRPHLMWVDFAQTAGIIGVFSTLAR